MSLLQAIANDLQRSHRADVEQPSMKPTTKHDELPTGAVVNISDSKHSNVQQSTDYTYGRPLMIPRKFQRPKSRAQDLSDGARPLEQLRSKMFTLDSDLGVLVNLRADEPPLHLPEPTVSYPPDSDGAHAVDEFSHRQNRGSSARTYAQNCSTEDTITSLPNAPYVQSVHFPRRGSVGSVISALTFQGHDVECPSQPLSNPNNDSGKLRRRTSLVTWKEGSSNPNHPHPALEFPPLYFLLRPYPYLLELSKGFFRLRWRLSYKLQKSIPCTRSVFRRMKIFLTLGDVLLILPFIAAFVTCTIYSFVSPSVSISGHAARAPLIFAFVTAIKNSPLTLLLGIPFERAIWYHKLSARIAYINGLMHTYVSFVHPLSHGADVGTPAPPSSSVGSDPNFAQFLFSDIVNAGGTMLLVYMTLMMITALPFVRRRVFEAFYYLHIVFAASMVACAFCHTGITVPILVALTWGVDLVIRKVYMARVRYPQKASVRIISESVVEVCFPKADGFDYNPGQYIFLAIPELSFFEWHPFSLSSSPEQKIVTLHIRKAGSWTCALYKLAETKMEISIMLEGPYGSVGVDLNSNRYKMIMLFSGGIGVTPMQALCNQLMFEHSTGVRDLKKLSFVWIERDPNVMQKVDVVRRQTTSSDRLFEDLDVEGGNMDESQGIANTLLSLFPKSNVTDEQLCNEYPSMSMDLDDDAVDNYGDYENRSILTVLSSLVANRLRKEGERIKSDDQSEKDNDGRDDVCSTDDDTMNQTFLDAAYIKNDIERTDALDLQVYLTSRDSHAHIMADLPFVHHQRPDVKELFQKMRDEALRFGEHRVAVCVCAPERLVIMCQKACSKFSDHKVTFDLHYEVF